STQIDGAVNNDVFGLSANGFPGGAAGPISLDAVGEVQLVVAPFDVRQGDFSAGGVNPVTRSGSNTFSRTADGFGRTEALVGAIPDILDPSKSTRVGSFDDHQAGFSLGGPIVRRRAFFFGNLEIARRASPSGFSVSGDSGQLWGSRTNVE